MLHENFKNIDLRDFAEEQSPEGKQQLLERYNKQCDQRFLCKACYEGLYKLNPNYLTDTGQYQYTTMNLQEFKKVKFDTIGEAVKKYG